jgi:parallel beta-helix repeat protein
MGISRKDSIERRGFLKRLGYVVVAALSGAAVVLGIMRELSEKVVIPSEVTSSYVLFIDARDGNLVKARKDTTDLIEYASQDATETIQYAIGALTNGGKILLEQGSYVLSGSLKSNGISGIELCGEGDLTVLSLANSLNQPVVSIISVNNWHVHDLQIDGNKANQATTSDKSYGILVWNCTNILIERNYIHDCKTFGIGFSASRDSKILNNHVNESGANGITIDNGTGGGNIVVQGNIVDGASDVGITAWVGKDLLVADNQIMNIDNNDSPFGGNTHLGMMAEGTSTLGSTGCTYSGNTVTNCAASGFSSLPGANAVNTNISVEDNQISNCKSGIAFSRTTGSYAQDNTISSCSLDGIVLLGSSSDNTINSNQVSGCKTGINIASPTDMNDTVVSNKLSGNTVALIDNGTGTVKSDNITTPVPEFPASAWLVLPSALGASVYLLRRKNVQLV